MNGSCSAGTLFKQGFQSIGLQCELFFYTMSPLVSAIGNIGMSSDAGRRLPRRPSIIYCHSGSTESMHRGAGFRWCFCRWIIIAILSLLLLLCIFSQKILANFLSWSDGTQFRVAFSEPHGCFSCSNLISSGNGIVWYDRSRSVSGSSVAFIYHRRRWISAFGMLSMKLQWKRRGKKKLISWFWFLTSKKKRGEERNGSSCWGLIEAEAKLQRAFSRRRQCFTAQLSQ